MRVLKYLLEVLDDSELLPASHHHLAQAGTIGMPHASLSGMDYSFESSGDWGGKAAVADEGASSHKADSPARRARRGLTKNV